MRSNPRHDWTLEEIEAIHNSPLLDLIHRAGAILRKHLPASHVQMCQLISIKTGGCPEDCKYCAQSSRYQTEVDAQPLMTREEAVQIAKKALQRGASRVCLGAAWREVKDSPQFERVLEMVRAITEMGLEVCCTLGMLTNHQAVKLAEAGLYAYNHNLDSSRDFYKTIITTRSYDDRLKTLDIAEKADLSVCCGGIIGMGESIKDRLQLLHTLVLRPKHPESIPINLLSPISGTPLALQQPIAIWEMIRMIATTRILFPNVMVRLSAGRVNLPLEQQALCFLAGANSIFCGEKLLTVGNPSIDLDKKMFELFGLQPLPPFANKKDRHAHA